MSSPTQRSKKALEDAGYLVAVVERWNPHAHIRQDLFGCIDLLGIREGETVGVQVTSASNVAARLSKLNASPALPLLKLAGWRVEVHGWAKPTKTLRRWRQRVEVVAPGRAEKARECMHDTLAVLSGVRP